jgi:hypothetical protein
MRQAQLSVEIIIILSALLIILMAIISSFAIGPESSILNKRSSSAREYSERLAYAINNIYLAGDGARLSLELPPTLLDGTSYSISIYPEKHLIDITWLSGANPSHSSIQVLTSGLSGKLSGIRGNLNITNSGGVIVIEN